MNDDFEDLEMDMDYGSEQVLDQPVQRSIKSKTPLKQSNGSSVGNRKNLFFRSTIGPERTEKLSIGEKTPVRDLKETIGNMFGLDPADFHVSHAGRTLNEDATPKDYSIDNGDELLLIPHSTAGSDMEFAINEIEGDDEEVEPVIVKSKQPQEEVDSKTPAKQTVGKQINIYFKSTIGAEKTEKLKVGDQTPFSDIKETLNNLFSLDSPDYNLSHAGRVLNDESTPKDYSVENNDEVLLIPFSTAGMGEDDFEDFDFDEDINSGSSQATATVQIKSKTPQMAKNPATANSAGALKTIFFRSTVGPEKNEKLSVGEKTPIRDIKETLGNLFSLEPDDFHLSHAGRTMNEDASPADYSIDNGDEVLLIPHSTAGFI